MLKFGDKVQKRSGKPFKSTQKVNTVKGYCIHPHDGSLCYKFEEDDSFVKANICKGVNSNGNKEKAETGNS